MSSRKFTLSTTKRYRLFPSVRLSASVFAMLTLFVAYACLFSINFCITCMVNSTAVEAESHPDLWSNSSGRSSNITACGKTMGSADSGYRGTLMWTTTQQSFILSASGYGGIAFVFVAGLIMDKTGTKWLNGITLALWALTTAIIPVLASKGWVWIFIVRIIHGALHCVSFPIFLGIGNTWFPNRERGILMSISITGISLGGLFTFGLAGNFCQSSFGWEGFMYMVAIVSGFVTVLWFVFYEDHVPASRLISLKEARYVLANRAMGASGTKPATPWKSLLTSGPVWAIFIITFTQFFMFYYIGDYMPSYYKEVFGLDAQSSGFLSAVPLIVQIVGRLMGGPLADFLERHISQTLTVKFVTVISSYLPPILLIGVTFFDCTNVYGAVVCFTLAYLFHAFAVGGFVRANAHIAPPFIGTLCGITFEFDYVANLLVPIVTGALIPTRSPEEWHHTLYVTAAICAVGATVFMILGSGVVQPWAIPEQGEMRDSIAILGIGRHTVMVPNHRMSINSELALF